MILRRVVPALLLLLAAASCAPVDRDGARPPVSGGYASGSGGWNR